MRSIFAMLIQEGLTICRIVDRLRGIPTKNDKTGVYPKKRHYGEWSRSSVRYILTNETYVGRWYYGKRRSIGRLGRRSDKAKADYLLCDPQPRETWLEVEVPPIISQETFDIAQKMLARNKRMAKRNRKHQYLLSGLIYCECGRAMVGAAVQPSTEVYRYYCCSARHEYSVAGPRCSAYRIPADAVEQAVWEHVHDLLMEPHNLLAGLEGELEKRQQAQEQLRETLHGIDCQLVNCERQLERLLDATLAGQFGKDLISTKPNN